MHIKMQSENASFFVRLFRLSVPHNLHTYKRVGPYVTYLKSRELYRAEGGGEKSLINILWWTWEYSDWIHCISYFFL